MTVEMAQYVYVLGPSRDGPLKIEIAGEPRSHLCNLQIGHPGKLYLFWVYPCAHGKAIEPLIHRILHGYMHTPAHPDTLVYESAELKDRSADQPDRKPLVPPFGRRLAIFAILSGSGLWVSLWGVSNLYDKRHRVATYAIAAGSVAFVAGWLVWFVTAFTWSWGWPV